MKKIVIEPNGLVSDAIALAMVGKVLNRDDGTVNFTAGLAVEIKTAKTQRGFKVVNRDEDTGSYGMLACDAARLDRRAGDGEG